MKKWLVLTLSLYLMCGCTKSEKVNNEPINIYLIRHGETLFNELGKAQGWGDSPLTDMGIKQAEMLGEGLKDIKFAKVYSSPSERAMDTANIVVKDTTIQINDDLKEMNFGNLEGEDGSKLWAKGIDYCFENGWKENGGEDFYLLAKRAMSALNEIVNDQSNNGKNVLISTHGMTILSILYEIAPAEADTLDNGLDNCSITILEYMNGIYTLKQMNDTSYLK